MIVVCSVTRCIEPSLTCLEFDFHVAKLSSLTKSALPPVVREKLGLGKSREAHYSFEGSLLTAID
jgi:hypothetical protein